MKKMKSVREFFEDNEAYRRANTLADFVGKACLINLHETWPVGVAYDMIMANQLITQGKPDVAHDFLISRVERLVDHPRKGDSQT